MAAAAAVGVFRGGLHRNTTFAPRLLRRSCQARPRSSPHRWLCMRFLHHIQAAEVAAAAAVVVAVHSNTSLPLRHFQCIRPFRVTSSHKPLMFNRFRSRRNSNRRSLHPPRLVPVAAINPRNDVLNLAIRLRLVRNSRFLFLHHNQTMWFVQRPFIRPPLCRLPRSLQSNSRKQRKHKALPPVRPIRIKLVVRLQHMHNTVHTTRCRFHLRITAIRHRRRDTSIQPRITSSNSSGCTISTSRCSSLQASSLVCSSSSLCRRRTSLHRRPTPLRTRMQNAKSPNRMFTCFVCVFTESLCMLLNCSTH